MDAREFGLCLLQLWFLSYAFQFESSSKMAKKWRTTLHNRKNISLGFWLIDSITNSKQLNTYRFWILESVDHQTLEHCTSPSKKWPHLKRIFVGVNFGTKTEHGTLTTLISHHVFTKPFWLGFQLLSCVSFPSMNSGCFITVWIEIFHGVFWMWPKQG